MFLINAGLTILSLSETSAGSTHDTRMADATPYPLPAGSRLLQDLGFLACMLDQAVEVTFEEARAHLGLETQRQWSEQAIARTTPVLLALFSLVTVLALRLSLGGQIPVPVTAWYHKAEPTFSDYLALVRRHLWRARYLVNSTPEQRFLDV